VTNLKIDIVSDVSCPWCIIGYKGLEKALENLDGSIRADLSWLPFELNPDMPIEGQEMNEHIQQKYGSSPEQAAMTRDRIKQNGTAVGFDFDVVDRIYNTFDSHRLLHWAKEQGKQTELKLALFNLYFQQAGNPSDIEQLLTAAEQIGLDKDQARSILESDEYTGIVREQIQGIHQAGINSVPSFIINDKYLLSGGQPAELAKEAMSTL